MNLPTRRSIVFPALTLLAVSAQADTIHRTDGSVIEDVSIQQETLTVVKYKEGRSAEEIPSDQVLRIEYSKMPEAVDEALGLLTEGDVRGAIGYLEEYVAREAENERKFKWAPAFASWKAVELRVQIGDLNGTVSGAARLIDTYGESRYLPNAYLAKAYAELWAGKSADARKTLEKLMSVVDDARLSKRWNLECRLAQTLADDTKKGDDKRKEIGVIVTEAGDALAVVRSRAWVAEGETYLRDADRLKDDAAAKTTREKARVLFQKVVDHPRSDDSALAGAYTGLGDCLFHLGADGPDTDLLKQASMNYLRVVTLYAEQGHYVPKALFYAMRCFDLTQDKQRKNDMRRELVALYPSSRWATNAEKF